VDRAPIDDLIQLEASMKIRFEIRNSIGVRKVARILANPATMEPREATTIETAMVTGKTAISRSH
jgi:hypothetical protein